jgi:hypothetical protein
VNADVLDERFDPEQGPGNRPPRQRRRVRSETDITKECISWLKAQPETYARKLHTGPMSGETKHPDIDGCTRGRSIKIEMKRPGEKPDRGQMARLLQWRAAGALVGWATSVEEVRAIFANAANPDYVNPLTGPGAPAVPEA